MTPEEELVDFEPNQEWWDAYMKWASDCNDAAEEQYEREQREQLPTPTPEQS